MKTLLKNLNLVLMLTLTVSLVLTGCFSTEDGNDNSDLGYEGFALSAEKDGKDSFNTEVDPKPLFEKDPEAFEAAKLPYQDEVDADEKPGLLPLPIDDNAEKKSRMVIISWGRGQAVSDKHDVRIWMGGIQAKLARIRAHRLVDFEDTDTLIRDQDANRVTFSTQTRDRMDGVMLRVTSKSRQDIKDGHLVFRTIGFNHLIPLRDIFSGKQLTIPVDRNGNVLSIRSIRRRANCPHGFMKARWDRVDKKGGVFRGLLMADEGEAMHKVAGVWGKAGGDYRFKGFVLNSNGSTRGILRGTFQPSATTGLDYASYRGHIINQDGEVIGKVRGVFTTPTSKPGVGHAKGSWKIRCAPQAEACDEEAALPAPKPLICVCKPNVTNVAPKEKPELTSIKKDKAQGKAKSDAVLALDVSADKKPLPVKPLNLDEVLDASDANCFCKLPLPKPSDCVANDADEVDTKPEPKEAKPVDTQEKEVTNDVPGISSDKG